MHVLDVGSGAGDVAFLAAELVGGSGAVVGVDRSLAALDTAHARAAERWLRNVSFLEGDPARSHSSDRSMQRSASSSYCSSRLIQQRCLNRCRTGAARRHSRASTSSTGMACGRRRPCPPTIGFAGCSKKRFGRPDPRRTWAPKSGSRRSSAPDCRPDHAPEASVGGRTNSSEPLRRTAELAASLSTKIEELGSGQPPTSTTPMPSSNGCATRRKPPTASWSDTFSSVPGRSCERLVRARRRRARGRDT